MVEQNRRKDNRWKVVSVVLAVVIVVVIAVAVAGLLRRDKYDEDYFVSDETKLVVAIDKDMASFEEGIYEPDVTYIVYYYDGGDTIKNMKIFFAYDDEQEAEVANENITLEGKAWAKTKNLSGRFVVFVADEGQYENLETAYVRKIIEDMKAAGTMYEPEIEIKEEIIDVDGTDITDGD